MTSPVPLIVTVWEIMVNIWMRHEMFLISWFSILHIQFSPNPNLSQEIVFSQVCHGIIAVFRGDIHTHWAIPEKIQTSGRGWGHRISRSIEEKNCGNSRGQLKKKWNFQEYSRKTHMKFPWVLIFDLRISKERVSHNFAEFPRVKLFLSWIFKVTVRNLNISGWEVGGGSEKYVFNSSLLFGFYSGIAHFAPQNVK